jgi:ABC-type multidrug transport system fused ATPase/permease subunit
MWLKKFPWLSLLIVLLSYGVFGWMISQSSGVWGEWIIAQGKSFDWGLEEDSAFLLIHGLALLLIVLISLALTMPVTLMTFFVDSSLKSEWKAFFSMLWWSLAFVVILAWFNYFVRFLVLLCAAILGRIELRNAGYREWQNFIILTLFCISGFALGILSYLHWGQNPLPQEVSSFFISKLSVYA